MTLFEFLMALASVVIAIALTEIFAGWGRLLRTHIVPRIDWLHLGWTLVIVLYAIQYWVGIWPYREIQFTLIYQVWFLIFPTLFIVLVSYAITPDIDPDRNLDLRDYYLSRRAPVFIGLAAFLATAQLADVIILDIRLTWISLALVVIGLLPAFTQRISIHTAVLIFNLYFVLATGFGLIPSSNGLIN
ncbi:MAG: hypothetical protein COB20_01715 [SAR86 cluster bacterium]|uniref:Uncharacterized protein n=1 Tax=SAR86 cluster bacterium TaxID=2030880 RepID=A0A2A4XFG9_9GAMM|nr:MAG: hypothetical protein COB20_01715 [SAR86 cluster bacterium]